MCAYGLYKLIRYQCKHTSYFLAVFLFTVALLSFLKVLNFLREITFSFILFLTDLVPYTSFLFRNLLAWEEGGYITVIAICVISTYS